MSNYSDKEYEIFSRLFILKEFTSDNIQKLSDLPTIDELGSAGLIDTSTIDKSIFGTGKFYKEQSISEKQNIYEDIDEAIKKTPEEEK